MTEEEEKKVELDHLLRLTELVHLILKEYNVDNNSKEILEIVSKWEMYPYITKVLFNQLPFFSKRIPQKDLEAIKKKNEEKIKELDEKIKLAIDKEGESEVRQGNLEKSQYYHHIGDFANARKCYKETMTKTVDLGQKIDIVFALIRLGFQSNDFEFVQSQVERGKKMIETGGDWERRNRMKVYEGTYLIHMRRFGEACDELMGAVATFSCYEFMTFHRFVFLTILVSMYHLERPVLKKKVIVAPDILTVIEKIPNATTFLNSLYDCKYKVFFEMLVKIETEMSRDMTFCQHINYYSREMRIKSYAQFLRSYKSVNLSNMCERFGVSMEFLDKDLARFIASQRLSATIDKVDQVVNTTRPKRKNHLFNEVIKKGDVLLARLQKLSRVCDL